MNHQLKKLKSLNLTVFWDLGISMSLFDQIGSLDREIAIYQELAKYLKTVNFITYGGNNDLEFKQKLKNINLYQLYWSTYLKNSYLTLPQILLKYRSLINQTDIIKTNQLPGIEVILWLCQWYQKRLIFRCGYLHSYFSKQKHYPLRQIKYIEKLEQKAFQTADKSIVTTQWQKDYVMDKYRLNPNQVQVIPNYILTNVFKPVFKVPKKYDLIYVGRGSKQKNLISLLKAIFILKQKWLNINIALVGSCQESQEIRSYVNRHQLLVNFVGNIKQKKLNLLLNQSKIFILPSLFEGHPKSLLEAMSSGLACIGTTVTGIKEEIKHFKTGYLCQTDPNSLAAAIKTLLKKPKLRKKMGLNARNYILGNYDLKLILKKEVRVLESI